MRWKTTLVLLIATIGIGTYVSRYELRQPTPEERQRLSRQVLNISADSVTQLALQMPQATLTLTRQGMTWRLRPSTHPQDSARSRLDVRSPPGVRADNELVNRLLSQTAPLMAERVLSPAAKKTPLDQAAFGFKASVGKITLTTMDRATVLLFGESTPVQHNRYLMVAGRPDIFVVSSALFDTANQPVETFRDTLLLRANTWLINSVTVSAAASFALSQRDNDWYLSPVPAGTGQAGLPAALGLHEQSAAQAGLTQPFSDRAERSEVSSLLRRLTELRIARFLDDAPRVEELSRWGFDHPKAEVMLIQQGSPPVSTTLFFGKPLDNDQTLLYAKRSDEPSLYAVAAADVQALLPDPNSLRARSCLDFFTGEAVKLEFTREGTGWTIAQTNGQWRGAPASAMTKGGSGPAGSGAVLDAQRVEALLNKLADLRLSGFVDDHPQDLSRYGLTTPAGVITVWTLNHAIPRRLLVGKTVESSTDRYGRIEGRDAVVRLPDAVTQLLATNVDDLRPRQATPAAPRATPTQPSSSEPLLRERGQAHDRRAVTTP